MEKVIGFPLLAKQTNLEKLELISKDPEEVYAFYSPEIFRDADDAIGRNNWMSANFASSSGNVNSASASRSTAKSEGRSADSQSSVDSTSSGAGDDTFHEDMKDASGEDKVFPPSSSGEEDLAFFTDHLTESMEVDSEDKEKSSVDLKTENLLDQNATGTTYQPSRPQQQQQQNQKLPLATESPSAAATTQLPLCLGSFQLSTSTSGSLADQSAFPFQKQLATPNDATQETDSHSRQTTTICQTSASTQSQLPPISDFQVSMKLMDEAETSALLDEANATGTLFGEDLFHERILAEPLTQSDATAWGIENVFNLSVQNPGDESIHPPAKRKHRTNSHQNNNNNNSNCLLPFFTDFCPALAFPSSTCDEQPAKVEQESNPFSFLHSDDPMIQQTKDLDDRLNVNLGDLSSAYAWGQFGPLLDGLGQTNEDFLWFGNYVTSLESETESKREYAGNLDGDEGGNEWSHRISHVFGKIHNFQPNENQHFVSTMETTESQKLSKPLARNPLGLKGDRIPCHGERLNPAKDSKPLPFGHHGEQKREKAVDSQCIGVQRKSKRSICLWQFLKELLHYPESYQSWIRWVDKNKGVFKIEDSMSVARLWGQRKNKPAMNYDKLSRSIRQYYKKGIIRKTTSSKRLVYQFCPQYLA